MERMTREQVVAKLSRIQVDVWNDEDVSFQADLFANGFEGYNNKTDLELVQIYSDMLLEDIEIVDEATAQIEAYKVQIQDAIDGMHMIFEQIADGQFTLSDVRIDIQIGDVNANLRLCPETYDAVIDLLKTAKGILE